MDCLDYNLFVNILTSLKSKSDLKWTLKTFNTGQFALSSRGIHLSNYEKKKNTRTKYKINNSDGHTNKHYWFRPCYEQSNGNT